ncbi:MAG: class I SAM-dependent methyltransferase [Cyclobacteriaceae bacterium]|nr:class I SAM-dependent methyltransferase [Cyclobacteriaceae bacterium]
MKVQAPGTILQNLYLKKRIRKWRRKFSFLEVGAGVGTMSGILLKQGGRGTGIDLNELACFANNRENQQFIQQGFYRVLNNDFFAFDSSNKFDVIVSMMVIEHLSPSELDEFLTKCKLLLKKDGLLVLFVPASNKYWGIEDEIAGHYKRYEFADFEELSEKYSLTIKHMAGLTFPLSNLLYPISNFFIRKAESYKLKLSEKEKTILSGKRDVPFKTKFPGFLIIILNEITLRPLHWLQMIFSKNANSMVIYCELKNE